MTAEPQDMPGVPAPATPVRPGEPGWEGRLVTLIDRLQRLCVELDSMGERQQELIETDEVEGLLELLRRRQGVVDSIGAVAGELDPVVRRWDELSGALEEAVQAGVREALDEIEEIGKRVGERDAEQRRVLESNRNQLADRIAGVGKARAAVSAYGPARGVNRPRFQDREG